MVSFWEPQQLVGTELYHSMHGNASGNNIMELETVRILMLTCGQTYLKLNFVLWM